jgi:hypothetical protein
MELDKVYFLPGDIVTLRQNIPNAPIMVMDKKVRKFVTTSGGTKSDMFQGILCRWFTTNMELQEAIFNTKDLKKV